jgi:hypothetical protein
VRIAYGRQRYRVEPVSGEGLMTVDSSRVEFVTDKVIYDAGGGEVIEFETQPSTVERVQEVIRKSGVSAEEAVENITKTSKPKSRSTEVTPRFGKKIKGGKK